jgi:hypothetical protein
MRHTWVLDYRSGPARKKIGLVYLDAPYGKEPIHGGISLVEWEATESKFLAPLGQRGSFPAKQDVIGGISAHRDGGPN